MFMTISRSNDIELYIIILNIIGAKTARVHRSARETNEVLTQKSHCWKFLQNLNSNLMPQVVCFTSAYWHPISGKSLPRFCPAYGPVMVPFDLQKVLLWPLLNAVGSLDSLGHWFMFRFHVLLAGTEMVNKFEGPGLHGREWRSVPHRNSP